MSEHAPPLTPSHRYFRAMHGRWRGRLRLTLTTPAALDSVRSPIDRLAWRVMSLLQNVLGPPSMETTVTYAADVVVHTTRLRVLGLVVASGVERFTLAADGRHFRMDAEHRLATSPWRVTTFSGEGEVADAADGARYVFPYLGADLVQTTRVDGDALVATQVTAFARSEVRLERRAETGR